MTFLWACMVLSLKCALGTILWVLVILAIGGIASAFTGGFAPTISQERRRKPDEDPKTWADEQLNQIKNNKKDWES